MAIFVEGVLIFNGLMELCFGASNILVPENPISKMMLPFSYNTEASELWSYGILALGVACIFAAMRSLRTSDQRYALPIVVGMLAYHVGLLYAFGSKLMSEEIGAYTDPALIQTIYFPDFIADLIAPHITYPIRMSPLDSLIQGLGTHISLFFLTIIAFCLCNTDGPLTQSQYEHFLRFHQQQLKQQQQHSSQAHPAPPVTNAAKSSSKKQD